MSDIHLFLSIPLSNDDKTVLRGLLNDDTERPPADAAEVKAEAPAPKKAPAKKAPAKKAEPVKEEPKAEEPAPEPEPVKEEAPAAEPEPAKEEPTESPLQPAISKAAELLAEGRTDDVKAALAKFDVERVSKLKVSDVEAFVKELDS